MWVLTYLIVGQANITVNVVDSAEPYCHSAVIGCAYMDGSRQIFVEPWWGGTDGLIAHEVTHIAMNEPKHTDDFRAKANELKQNYGEEVEKNNGV